MATGGGLTNQSGRLYLIKEVVNAQGAVTYYKIGGSVDPKARLKDLQTGNPRELRLVKKFKVGNMKAAETYVHKEVLKIMEKTELNGGTEWFSRISINTTDTTIKNFIGKAIQDLENDTVKLPTKKK